MCYLFGDAVSGRVNNVKDNGVFVTLENQKFGFMPKKLMRSFVDANGVVTAKVGQLLNVIVYKVTEKGILLCDYISYEGERMRIEREKLKTKANDFVATLSGGEVLEVEVADVKPYKAIINIGYGLKGVIEKDEANWNEINRLNDLLYIGETITAVYLGTQAGEMKFSLKLLNEKPYDDELYDLSLSELLKRMGHIGNEFIGIAKSYGANFFIENLYSANGGEEGRLLVDPKYGYNLRAVVPNKNFFLEEGHAYKVIISLLPKEKRYERNQLFQFVASHFEEVDNPYKKDVENTFKMNTSPKTNQVLTHLLAEVGKNMYSSKERMFFELIQNADDAASENGVYVKASSLGDYLLVQYNGYSFDAGDFDAITSVATGTKKANENKTGYKGIGFKSVFTDSEKVFIKTGGYQFKFDKCDSRFLDFDSFYFYVNDYTGDRKKEFLRIFQSFKTKFKQVEDIPWQLEPIWVDSFPKELGENFTGPNVSIALKLGENKILDKDGYKTAIDNVINNPKFMLFLRKTNRIDFDGRTVSKTIDSNIVTLENSFNDERMLIFERKDYIVKISNEIFLQCGIDIRIKVDDKDATGKIIEAKFVDMHGSEMENIPKKIAINNSTAISFAVPLSKEGKLVSPVKNQSEISLFAFLPTLVKDFKFPIFINANFILSSSREHILGDNPWNFFLMREIAKKLVDWSAEMCSRKEYNALNILVSKPFDDSTIDIKNLAEAFNSSYEEALNTTPFILDQCGQLAKIDEIVIDDSGLSDVFGQTEFCLITGIKKKLPSNKIDTSILKGQSFRGIERINLKSVIKLLKASSTLYTWFKTSSEAKKDILIKWVLKTPETCLEIINSLPIFEFDNESKSCKEINHEKAYIITNKHILPIKDILTRLGFHCSVNFLSEHPLASYVEVQSEKDLYNKIVAKINNVVLIREDKANLMLGLKDFDGIGESIVRSLPIFKNKLGVMMPLSQLTHTDKYYLNSFSISDDDYCSQLDDLLIPKDKVFSKIFVYSNFSEIFNKDNIGDVYNDYGREWNQNFWTDVVNSNLLKPQELINIIDNAPITIKSLFLQRIERLELANEKYDSDSFEYKCIKIAQDTRNISTFLDKIFIDNEPVSKYLIDDNVIIYEGYSRYCLSLSEILPGRKSSVVQKFKNLFPLAEVKGTSLDRKTIVNELITYLSGERKISPAQFVFVELYNKSKDDKPGNFDQLCDKVSAILEQKIPCLDYCFKKDINDIADCISTPHVNFGIRGKFFPSSNLLEDELLPNDIVTWADSDEKKNFLFRLGARKEDCPMLKIRKAFRDGNITTEYISDRADIKNTLKWVQKTFYGALTYKERGFDNRVSTLCNLLEHLECEYKFLDYDDCLSKATELESNDAYFKWKLQSNTSIYICSPFIPKKIKYLGDVICEIDGGPYVYSINPQSIFISDKFVIQSVLSDVADDKNCTFFSRMDWEKLFWVSRSEVDELKQKYSENESLLKRYRERYGDIDIVDGTIIENREYVKVPVFSRGESNTVSKDVQYEAQIEAQKFLMKEKSKWQFPDGYGEYDAAGKPKCYSCVSLKDENDKNIKIVLKSHKIQSDPFKINSSEWDYIAKKEARLLVYTGCDVKMVNLKDLVRNQSNVSITFSTENLNIEERIDAFADSLHFFKELHFDFESFNLSEKANSIRDMYRKNDGMQGATTDEDL